MGPLELLVILLIAFVVLGPERMVDVGRWMGKAVAQLRDMSAGLPDLIADPEQEAAGGRTVKRLEAETEEPPHEEPEGESAKSKDEGPVPFRRSSVAPKSQKADSRSPDSQSEEGS